MKIAIVDYGMGNIKSISSSLKYLGVDEVVLTNDFTEMQNSDKIILPGVGSFGKAMSKIKEIEIDIFLKKLVFEEKKPILGICLGMQLLSLSSDEDGENNGLGMIDTIVRKFPENKGHKIPHVGFNQVKSPKVSKLFFGLKQNSDFYFIHSYRMIGEEEICASICNYGGEFIAAFEKDNIAGVQFHPELSQANGLHLLKNFIEKF